MSQFIWGKDPAAAAPVETLKKDISKKAEDLIYKKFPQNIAKLCDLLKSELWQINDYSQIVSSLPPAGSLLISSAETQKPESNGHQQLDGIDTSVDGQEDASEVSKKNFSDKTPNL